MSSIRRAITDFCFSIFLFSINVAISRFIECRPVESTFPPPFPQILCARVCVCVCGRGVWGGGGVQVRVCVCE